MKISTRHFGEIEVSGDHIIRFADGIPGFEEEKDFALITDDEKDSAFCWLQSVNHPDVSFVLLDSFKVIPSYRPEVNDTDAEYLGLNETDQYVLLNITVIPEDSSEMTTNLLAPIIINLEKRIGRQVILENSTYTVRHNVFGEIKKQKAK